MPQPSALRKHGAAALAAENRSDQSVATTHWFQARPNPLAWDKSYPYQLLVLQRLRGGSWQIDENWRFTLPISPQQLTISMVFANELNLNQEGASESTSPVRLYMIRSRFTLGTLPLRPSAPMRPFNPAQTIFAGTVNAAGNVLATNTALVRDVQPQEYQPPNVMTDADFETSDVGRASGFYQALLLRQFLERYCELKASEAGKNRQLAFAVWKEQAVWLITVQAFDADRAVPHVLRYDCAFQAKAWARVSVEQSRVSNFRPDPISTTPDKLSRAINTVRDARRVLYQSRQLVGAAVSDATNLVLEPLREVSLLLQDTAGNTASLAEMPRSVVRASKAAVLSLLSARDAFSGLPDSVRQRVAALGPEVEELRALGSLLSRSDTRTSNLEQGGALSNAPANGIFDEPEAHFELFSALRPGDLQLQSSTQSAIAKERARVRALSRHDFEQRRAKLQLASDTYANFVGLGSSTYDKTLGRPPQPARRAAVEQDYEVLFALNASAQVLDSLAAQAPQEQTAVERSLAFVSKLAAEASIPFSSPRSKFEVPFPAGCTLEQLAERYLGDPDRWHEIAQLNALREPYVDEVGWSIPVGDKPVGNRVVLSEGGSFRPGDLRPGTPVSIVSRVVPELRTVVMGVERVGARWMVTLGDDVSHFLPSDLATIRGFAPDTVNSACTLWIPSDEEPADEDVSVRDSSTAADRDPLVRMAGTDLLLTQSNDLVVTRDGDWTFARGLPLVTQVVRTALGTPRGSLLHHQSYGLPPVVGESLADLGPREQAEAIRDTFNQDPLFAGVDSLAVIQNGPVETIGMTLSVAGLNRPVQLSVERIRC